MTRGSRTFLLIAVSISVFMGMTRAFGEDAKPAGKVALGFIDK
jgi:hypothetical protein